MNVLHQDSASSLRPTLLTTGKRARNFSLGASGHAMEAPIERRRSGGDLGRVESITGKEIDLKRQLVARNPNSLYKFGARLGAGHFGEVFSVTGKPSAGPLVQGRVLACKVINTNQADLDQQMVERECGTLMLLQLEQLQHPHLIQIVDSFQFGAQIYLVMPKVSPVAAGQEPDLMGWLMANPADTTEEEGAKIVQHVASAVQYLNQRLGVIHRDLKPENILVGPDGLDHLKVTDFGLSRLGVQPQQHLQGTFAAGTPGYMAPELLDPRKKIRGKIDYGEEPFKVDVFSLGVVLFSALVKYAPFNNNGEVLSAKDPFDPPDWQRLSSQCRNLTRRMMCHDQATRLSIDEVLGDPWLFQTLPPPVAPFAPVASAPAEEADGVEGCKQQ